MKGLSTLWRPPYRVVRKLATANINCVFARNAAEIRFTPWPVRFRFEELSVERLRLLADSPDNPFDDTQRQLLEQQTACGFAVFDGDAIAAYAWVAVGDVPAEFNEDGNPLTQLPLFLPPGCGYIFNVFVVPAYRGQRLYGAMMSQLAETMQGRGITRLIVTTEGSNFRALRSVRRMGFEELGRAMLFRVGRFCWARYPAQPLAGDLRLGRYVGDCTVERAKHSS